MVLFTLSSQCSSCFLFLFSISWYFCPPSLFSENSIFLIYFSLLHILAFHLYLTNLPSWHLFLFTSKEGGRTSLLSCDLHYSSHFLINTADKTVAYHLMWRQHIIPNWKLSLLLLILSLQTLLPTWNVSESFVSSLPLLGWISFSGLWYPRISTATLQLHPRLSDTYNICIYIVCHIIFVGE